MGIGNRNPATMLRNSKGFLSADFLFSIVIASCLCAVFFSLSFTLSMVEVGQYIAFSVTRAHSAGHKTQEDQENAAKAKFKSLQTNKVFAPLFSNGWFEIGNLDIRGGGENGRDFTDRYPSEDNAYRGVPQTGIRLDFFAKILDIKVPLLGPTDPEGKGFKAFLTGLMIREPSSQECQDQIKSQRFQAIMNLDKRFEGIAGPGSQRDYVPMEDNGC